METVLKLLQATGDRKINNHRRLERRGIVNYLYFNVPVVIIDRRKREVIINNWKNQYKGINRVVNSYLDSVTVKYLLKSNYKLIDRRVKNDK